MPFRAATSKRTLTTFITASGTIPMGLKRWPKPANRSSRTLAATAAIGISPRSSTRLMVTGQLAFDGSSRTPRSWANAAPISGSRTRSVKSMPGCVRWGCGLEYGSTGSPADRNVPGRDALKTVAEDPERYLATAAEMLMAEGMTDAAEILRTSTAKIEETGYDNWNGGT